MSESARPRLSYAQAARSLLRESVLTTVDELVRKDGWAATTVEKVAKTVGISRQTVYNEFGNKQSLAEAYITHRLDKLLVSVRDTVLNSPDLETGLHGALTLFFEFVDEPLIRTVLSGSGDRTGLTDLLRDVNERSVEELSSLLQTVKPNIDDYDAMILADSIARLAVAHAIVPTIESSEATKRLVRLAQIVLAAIDTP
ncbi:TetR/AcrR family transcriptional regulator [Hoyosella rhizosphaerae]|uniref:TetR family transcriptional regulator n=1 Tax=Hoyosella rhizosphaerae TaxID=1755582 RepID=A0A916U230_9ACTN|nr:TetR/AcrR family transcriptional regulator [Hoyosella rhizosphaerae]MBN4926639.1 TetR/AcrR family transcriptional regulator [Hoyosella rhizosphaerae]GGC57624.1 TetR family transcriptional regulator [Hoyosella rhizosphaerae]